jgi:hypothetical protein
MFSECLVLCSMRLGVPFIAPRQLGAVEVPIGRQFLPSVGWHTGQSGAPPDMNSSSPVLDLLPYQAQPSVGPPVPLAHLTLSGAHRTLSGVTNRPLVRATRRPLIAQPSVGAGGFGLPDSPVNFTRGAIAFSRERRVRRWASLGTGQCGAPQAGVGLAELSKFFSNSISFDLARFLVLR